jgi:hypothetical protein
MRDEVRHRRDLGLLTTPLGTKEPRGGLGGIRLVIADEDGIRQEEDHDSLTTTALSLRLSPEDMRRDFLEK